MANSQGSGALLGVAVVLVMILLLAASAFVSDREMMEFWHGKSWPDSPCELMNKCR